MKMFLTLASVVAFAVLSVLGSNPPLRVKFGSFEEMPKSKTEAVEDGWTYKERPSGAPRASCDAYCEDTMFKCMLYDQDNGYLCGMSINIAEDIVEGMAFDWETQGYISWNSTYTNGTSVSMKTIHMFFVSEDYLALDADERASSYNETTVLQEGYLMLSWFNGEEIKIANTSSGALEQGFTKQNYVPLMGTHYYYAMTNTTECTSSTISPWFMLYDSAGSFMAVGYSIFAKLVTSTTFTVEDPAQYAVEYIVPYAPQCYYDMADSPGVVTMHTYVEPLANILTVTAE